MSDYVTLMGAEDVRAAGNAMRQAAESISQSVGYLDEILRRHREEMREMASWREDENP
jgi:hypothetical protein